jgi:Ferritin-like
MATQIQYPEDPVPRPRLLAALETIPTIGQFYDAVLEAFQENTDKIPYDQTHQQSGPLSLFVIDSIYTATCAIRLIQQQGEVRTNTPSRHRRYSHTSMLSPSSII